MNREKKLMKNTLIITVGKICTQLITFFLLPLYTGVLSTEEFGIVDLLNTIVSLLLPIVTFQVEHAVFRELIEVRDNEEKKKQIISSSIITVIVQCGLFILLYLLFSRYINNQYKIYLLLNVIAYIFSSLMLQITRGLGDNKKYALGSFISAVSTVLFNLLFLLIIKLRADGLLLGTFFGQLFCFLYLFCFLKIYKYIDVKSFSRCLVKSLWKYSIPLIPNAISWWIFNASDRLIVSSIIGLSANGLLATANKFSGVIITIYNIFHISWTESVALHINDDDIEIYFNKTFNFIFKEFVCIVILAVTVMPFAFRILINEKFFGAYTLIPILLIASLFNVLQGLVAVVYSAKKNTKAIATTSIWSAVLNIVIHFALISKIGLYAAAISTLIAFMIISLYRCYDINKKYIKLKIDIKFIISALFVLIILCIIYYINNLYLNIISIFVAVCYTSIINKKNFTTILGLLKIRKSEK